MNEFGGEVLLYRTESGGAALEVRLDGQTVWLSLTQLAELFGRDKSTISRHLSNVFSEGELDRGSVVADLATTAADGKTYQVTHFNLDVIISVGYRVKSFQGTQFRIWATERLRQHLLGGYTLNEHRLAQLGKVLEILQRSDDVLVSGVAELLRQFTGGLDLLDRYDHQSLGRPRGQSAAWQLTYDEARSVIDAMSFGSSSELFGRERDGSFAGVVAGLYQTFGGVELYPSVEEKEGREPVVSGGQGSLLLRWQQAHRGGPVRLLPRPRWGLVSSGTPHHRQQCPGRDHGDDRRQRAGGERRHVSARPQHARRG